MTSYKYHIKLKDDRGMANTLTVEATKQNSLLRIIGLLCRFGINLDSMTVKENKDSNMYTIRIKVICEDKVAEQFKKQIQKQVDVISVH